MHSPLKFTKTFAYHFLEISDQLPVEGIRLTERQFLLVKKTQVLRDSDAMGLEWDLERVSYYYYFFNSSDVQLGSQVWEMVTSSVLSD